MRNPIIEPKMIGKEMKKLYLATANIYMKLESSNNMFKLLKKSALALLFVIPLVFSGQKAKATHMMGSDITYRCIDTLKFEVTLKWYRDCRGISLNNAGTMTVRCSNGASRNVTLSLVGIREITPLCATEPSRCNPSNTTNTGEGVEEHTYRGVIDFNVAPLSSLANCTGRIIFGAQVNARNGAITTGPSGTLYTDAELDISKAPCNTSPGLTSEPIAVLCCDQPFFFNNGALDTANFDSLSYDWGQPQSGYGQQTSYSGNFAYNNPFTAFYPSPALTFPYNNPNQNPPHGVYLDPLTGDIIVTPTNCQGEVTVAVIVVTEWRRNAAGVMEDIGKTRRDLQFIVKQCPGNKPPVVNGPYSHNVCEGSQLCFNITTNDLPFIPPPPAPIPPLDTVTLDWNGGIAGATFTILNPTARLKTGRFCWTPPIGSASTLPYTFTATARDDACPLNAVTVRGYRITVKPKALAEIDIDTMACGIYPIKAVLPDGFRGTASYNWSLLDSNRNFIFSDKSGSFQSTGNFLAFTGSDTLVFRRGGKYIIQLSLNNNPLNCPSTFYDTIVVPPLLEADLSVGQDTFVCAGTDIVFKPTITNYTPPLSYQWITMGVENDGTFLNNVSIDPANDKDTFKLSVPNVQYDTAVGLIIADGSGCTANDTVQVFLKSNPLAVLPPDTRLCTYEEITVVPNLDTAYWIDPDGVLIKQGDTLFKQWYVNGGVSPFSIEDSVTVNIAGEYIIFIKDSLDCSDRDTMYVYVNDTVVADAGPDQTICLNDTFTLSAQGIDTAGGGASGVYVWWDVTPGNPADIRIGTVTDTSFVAVDNRVYRLELYRTQDGVECYDDDTVVINVDQLPVISLSGKDDEICCDAGAINLNTKITAPTGGSWYSYFTPTLINNSEYNTDMACGMIVSPATNIETYATYIYQDPSTTCINKDSVKVTVKALPTLITQQKEYCQDIGEVRLSGAASVFVSPNAITGTPEWRCLDSNSAVNRFQADMLKDRGVAGINDYWLDVSESAYTIQNGNSDTIVLEIAFRNQFGCRNKDTVNVIISKVPKIIFRDSSDLCIDLGEVRLNEHFDVNLTTGWWSIESEAGYRLPAELGGLLGDTINTLNSTPLANVNATPNSWLVQYGDSATGCPAFRQTTLRINPLPVLNLTDLPARICEDQANVDLQATPAGGTWTSSDPTALVGGSQFSPSSASVFGQEIKFLYNYTDGLTGCEQKDSITSSVDLFPTLNLPTDAVYCRQQGQMTLPLTLDISATNAQSISWIPTNVYGNLDRIATTPIDQTTNQGQVTLTLQTQSADTFLIGANAEALGSCTDVSGPFEIIVNPLPIGRITNTNPEGCNPVITDLGIEITNDVDASLATLVWDLGDGTSSTAASINQTYDVSGQYPITVTVTSDKDCDSTFTSNVQVNPIPNARFTPNPNNYTTAALPRFIFNDASEVDDINGAEIVRHSWDFGDELLDSDTSNEVSPSYYYSTDTATYCVNLQVITNHGCVNDTTVCVVVGPDLIVFVPNAFTPNESGPSTNEGFKAIISGEKTMELTIFNRWGEILFQSDTKDEEWDGTYKGEPAQQDVYAYQLKVTALNDEVYTYTGTVTLIR